MTFGRLMAAVIALFAIYFPLAIYLNATYGTVRGQHPTYVPAPAEMAVYWLAYPPFQRVALAEKGNAYVAWLPPAYDDLADTEEEPRKSPLILYEDGKPLGPAHSLITDIIDLGGGRYLHLKGQIVFSPSDNGSPNAPWRKYSVRPAFGLPAR